MTKKQLIALYICYLIPYIIGNSFLPFLPIYAARLGVSPSVTGYYLAIAFAALAVGTMSGGKLSEQFQRRKVFIFIGCLGSAIGCILMAIAPDIVTLTVATTVLWFCGGIITSMVLILTGLSAPETQRGRTFGILSTALSVAAIIGGTYSGRIIEAFDYTGLFVITSMFFVFPLVAVFAIDDHRSKTKSSRAKRSKSRVRMSQIFWFIFIGSTLVYGTNFASNLIQPIIMVNLKFRPTDISSLFIVAGMFTLPLPFAIGWLSDRIGRKWLLAVAFLSTALGLLITIFANVLWHFWLARIALGMFGTSLALGSALLTDMSPPDQLDTALSRFATTPWIGGVLGYLLTGMSIEQFGMTNTLWITVLIAIIGSAFILRINSGAKFKRLE